MEDPLRAVALMPGDTAWSLFLEWRDGRKTGRGGPPTAAGSTVSLGESIRLWQECVRLLRLWSERNALVAAEPDEPHCDPVHYAMMVTVTDRTDKKYADTLAAFLRWTDASETDACDVMEWLSEEAFPQ